MVFRKKNEEKKKQKPRTKKKRELFPEDEPFTIEEMIFYDEIMDDE